MGNQSLTALFPKDDIIKRDFAEGDGMITVVDLCKKYNVDPERVWVSYKGKVLLSDEKFDVRSQQWFAASRQPGG